MIENPSQQLELEINTNTLKQKLKEFASSDFDTREQLLPELAIFIQDNVNKEVIENSINKESLIKEELVQAIELAKETPFDIKGDLVNPWTKEGTIVVLDSDGNIAGSWSEPTKGLEDYGDLHPYALHKALFSLHLNLANKSGGLEDESNFEYISGLVSKDITVFTGAPIEPLILSDKKYFIGSSGCAVTDDYVNDLMGGMGAQRGPNTLAGYHDGIFAEHVQFYMEDNHLVVKPMKESPFIKQVRKAN